MSLKVLKLLIPAILIELGLTWVLLFEPIELRVVETIAILVGTSAVYIISAGLILKKRQPEPERWTMAVIIGFALLFRITIWPLSPGFTDDLYRYRWEARALNAGLNPYYIAPNDLRASALKDETFTKITGRDFAAVYGPLIELVNRGFYSVFSRFTSDPRKQIFWLKLPAALFELGVLAGIGALLRAHRQPGERLLLYAWSPLPVFEFWGNGHNDTVMLCALVWAFWAAEKGWGKSAFSLLGAATAAKLWPAALLPVFLARRGWKPARLWEPCLLPAVALAFLVPFGWGILGNLPFVSGFLGGWRNNDSFFGALLWITGDVYRAKYSAFALLLIAVAVASFSSMSRTKAALVVIIVMLLVSANCHPWYLSWILILVPLHPSLGLLAWTALTPLAYHALPAWIVLSEWHGSTPMRWFIYAPVFAVLILEFLRSSRPDPPESAKNPAPA